MVSGAVVICGLKNEFKKIVISYIRISGTAWMMVDKTSGGGKKPTKINIMAIA